MMMVVMMAMRQHAETERTKMASASQLILQPWKQQFFDANDANF